MEFDQNLYYNMIRSNMDVELERLINLDHEPVEYNATINMVIITIYNYMEKEAIRICEQDPDAILIQIKNDSALQNLAHAIEFDTETTETKIGEKVYNTILISYIKSVTSQMTAKYRYVFKN